MSDKEIIERVQKNVESPMILTDTGLEAAEKSEQSPKAKTSNGRWSAVWRCISTVRHA